jgi:predicted NAD-dependent protein-ADP-ribosyltransferase YbiA (DUF1768 family)
MNADVLMFYSKSRDSEAGKGANEYVKDPSLYYALSRIKDWRKVLSNFHMHPFTFNQREYNSIEHAFQAEKIRLASEEAASRFEIGNYIGDQDASVAQKNRKLVRLSPELLRKWNSVKTKKMADIAHEKYNQCPFAMHVLILTRQAQLWHIVMRSKYPVRFTHLENIRLVESARTEGIDGPQNTGPEY